MQFPTLLILASLLLSVQAGVPESLAAYIKGVKQNALSPHEDCKAADPDSFPKHFTCIPQKQPFHYVPPADLISMVIKLKKVYPESSEGGRIKATSMYLAKDFQVTGQSVFKEGVNFDALFWTVEYGPGCEFKDEKDIDKNKWCLTLLIKDNATDEAMKKMLTQQPTGDDGVETINRQGAPQENLLASTAEGRQLIANTFGLHKEGTRQMTEEESKEVLEALTAEDDDEVKQEQK
jgi:hypothetical protein